MGRDWPRTALRVSLLFGVALLTHGCGDDTAPPAATAGSVETGPTPPAVGLPPALLRWNEYSAAFPFPEPKAWKNSASAEWAKHTPHHNGYDLFLKSGQAAPIEAKFHYGDLYKDLEGEDVALYLRKAGSGTLWIHVADATTDDDGRVSIPFPATVIQGPGTYYVRFVVYGDLTVADALVRVVEGATPSVVFDIDGTLTNGDWELVKETLSMFVDLNYIPRMYNGANKVAVEFAKAGYEIVYLTARPYWLTHASRRWLALKGLPLGTVHTRPGWFTAGDTETHEYKRDKLIALQQAGAQFAYAFGNAKTDISAYEEAGIPKNKTYIIGSNAGQGGTIALAKYTDLYGTIVPTPSHPYRVVLVVVDGLRPDALTTYLAQYAAADSALKSLFGTTVDVKKCVTTAPSYTFPAQASIATGRNPASTGISANSFFDRKTQGNYEFDSGATYAVDDVLNVYRNEGAANKVLQCQTLYEQMSSSGRYGIVGTHQFFRGGEYLQPSLLQMLMYLTDVRGFDRKTTDSVLSRLDGTDVPDLVTIYWSGMDHEAHSDGKVGGLNLDPNSLLNTELNYLKEVVDPELAKVKAKLASLGILQTCVFVLCSDHGHRDVVKDDAHAVDLDLLGIDNEIAKVLEDSPYDDVYDKGPFEGDFDSHAALSGGVMHVTLRNRATNQWKDAPRFVEDVLPVVGSIQQHRLNGELVNAVEEILVRTSPTQPYQVVRPTRVKITFDQIKVIDDNDTFGSAEATFDLRANGKVLQTIGEFSVDSGDTVNVNLAFNVDVMPGMELKVECTGDDDDFWVFDDDYGTVQVKFAGKSLIGSNGYTALSDTGDIELTFHVEIVPLSTYSYPELPNWGNRCPLTVLSSEYVDAPARINALAHPTRSGDILVLAAFRDGFYFGGKNGANHGSLYPEDSIQAFFVGGPPLAQGKVVQGASVVDIAATIANILGIDLRGKEGVSRVDPQVLPLLPAVP